MCPCRDSGGGGTRNTLFSVQPTCWWQSNGIAGSRTDSHGYGDCHQQNKVWGRPPDDQLGGKKVAKVVVPVRLADDIESLLGSRAWLMSKDEITKNQRRRRGKPYLYHRCSDD